METRVSWSWLKLLGWAAGLWVVATLTALVSILVGVSLGGTDAQIRTARAVSSGAAVLLMSLGAARRTFPVDALARLNPRLETPWSLLLPALLAAIGAPLLLEGHQFWADALALPPLARMTLDLLTWLVLASVGIVLAQRIPAPGARAARRKEFTI